MTDRRIEYFTWYKDEEFIGCGCEIENLASQKTIEKSGFVSRYKMINYKK